MQHDPATRDVMTYADERGEPCAVGLKLPYTQQDWHAKRPPPTPCSTTSAAS